ncbi:putative leucine-rich repeat domain superfamily [Helianthus annuus]|nr:putative leucine-rich repeat domain superfamily [Helianthus annuus]
MIRVSGLPIGFRSDCHPYLLVLDLSRNNFYGELPENIGNAKKIGYLSLSENNISGQIPMSIFKIDTLIYLDLSTNRLFGDNLPLFGDKSMLHTLDLPYNNFSGNIPINFPKGIRHLYLCGNKFSGNLPWNLTRLVDLRVLDFHGNNITGKLQDTLPQNQALEAIILRNNSLEGYIPSNIYNLTSLRILDLSWNNLTGSLPQEMANLPIMMETHQIPTLFPTSHSILALDRDFTYRDLVVTWKKSFQGLAFRNFDTYTLLDVSHNKISGEIPSSLGNLKALKLFNISHNRISGHIPVSFGDLQNIESLDLSHNEISGSIPQSLVKLKQVSVLDLSNNRLTGKIPVGSQMDTMTEFGNNAGLCGMQIGVTCPEDIRPSKEKEKDDEDGKNSWFLWEGTWVGFPFGFFSSIVIMGYFLDFLRLFKLW